METESIDVEITPNGYLRLSRDVASRYFPNDVLLALCRDQTLLLLPTRGPAAGGMILKQRNPQGERSVLVNEVFAFRVQSGSYQAIWDENIGGLRVPIQQEPVPITQETVA
jgi:hypothetical protein